MPQQVCHGALLACSFGVAPSSLMVLPTNRVMTSSQPAATIMDHQPMVNIAPFGLCLSLSNHSVRTIFSIRSDAGCWGARLRCL